MVESETCKSRCWMAGAGAGLIVAAWLALVSHFGFFPAIFMGLVTCYLFGSFLIWAFCEGRAIGGVAKPAAQPTAKPVAPVATAPAESAPAPLMSAPAKAEPVQAEAPKAEPAKAETPAKAEKPVAEKPAKAAKPAPEDDPAVAADIAAVEAAGAGTQPAVLEAARAGVRDNLEVIEGIGPVLHGKLNEAGIFHYDQIAAWSVAEVAWIETNVKRAKGRVTRDKWVAQAKLIVSEGVEAFLIRAKTNNY